ncbi:MAG TPA: AsmA-like C-terminal region-containing protein [Vicinamibacterales bacterium]|nr:AsmA-like C-terminal region-containing protein [Vicinamibacterales bacterium]
MTIWKAVRWSAIAVMGTLVALTIVAAAGSRTGPLRRLVIATLAERLDSDVELAAFSVDTFPRVVIRGEGLTLSLRAQAPNLPPLIQIKSFVVHSSLMDLMQRPRRFREVTLDGLVVNIPPGGIKIGGPRPEAAGPLPESQIKPRDRGKPGQSPILVDVLTANGAMLRIIPRREGKDPKEFAIHALTMTTLGLAQQMPFTATLTNPLPKGLIETTGTFGPWRKDDPGTTPLAGDYSFQKADLGTIKGIGGILDSTGRFDGQLDKINVKGTTTTPDFHLDIAGQPVALSTSFVAVVDGTDGDTYLNEVNAQFLSTALTAKGAVVGTKGVKGRTIDMNVVVHEGRIEDLLTLAVKADKPLLVGSVALRAAFHLPPGEPDVIERMELKGQFDVGAATFTDRKVQEKLVDMSKRARGLDEDEAAGRVVSNLSGTFDLKDTTLSFSRLSFSLPGAQVRLHGAYGLRSEAIEFDGTVRMQATISEAAGGGAKGFFLKMIDPVFRKQGAGAVVPIKVRGTREQPKFSLDVGRVFKSK